MLNALINWFKPSFHIEDCISVAASLRGIRQENQDNYLLINPDGRNLYLQGEKDLKTHYKQWSNTSYRLAVADGMGGHEGGRQVSQALIQKLRSLALQMSAKQLRQSLYQIHYELWCTFSKAHTTKSAGTTLVMADVQEDGQTVIANIGDSRAYLWRNKHWRCLSHDQTLSEYDWRDGDIDDETYQAIETSAALSQAVAYGSFGLIKHENTFKPRQLSQHLRLDLVEDLSEDKQDHADVFQLQLQTGDALLLASDGFWSGCRSEEEFLPDSPKQLETPAKMRHYFQKTVIETGGTDNVTAVMLWNTR
jgi:serine/threonine protein phosphatase PrpC